MKLTRLILSLVLLVIALSLSPTTYAFTPPLAPPEQQPQGSIVASTATMGAPTMVHVQMTNTVPELTDQQKALLEARSGRGPLPAASPLPVGTTAVQRADSAPNPRQASDPPARSANASPTAPGTFTMFRNTTFGATIKANTSGLTGEPTISNLGPLSFATGNWWGAVSQDGGQTFQYVNPYTQFPASYGGFCCDQWTVYDPSRDIFIWYLQYISSNPGGGGRNIFRLAVGRPTDVINGTWWFYDFTSDVGTEWDYPDMWLGNDNLYITTNRGPYAAGYVDTSFVFRIPLDPISTGAGFGYGVVDFAANGFGNLSWKGARANRDTMYMAAHNTTSQIRIMRWAENSGSLFWDDVNLSATWPNATHVCPTPDGRDWCGFDDGRIKAGWMGRGLLGWQWNTSAGGGFTYSHIDAVQVRESDRVYVDRPYIFGASGAHQYSAAAPNMRGDVGMVGHYSSSSFAPYLYVAINDDYTRDAGNTWDVNWIRISTQGPNGNRWGDYFSVNAYNPNGLAWLASGTTMQGCGAAGCKETQFMVYGRERDTRGVNKFLNMNICDFLPLIRR